MESRIILTQASPKPDLFTIFEEEEERSSIAHPHLVTIKMDSKGKETLTPHHLFQGNSIISFSVGSQESKPDVAMDKKDNIGPSMSQFSLSNQAFSIESKEGHSTAHHSDSISPKILQRTGWRSEDGETRG